jgi:RNA polymerase sigma-70 factor (sigma-E family)
VSGGGSTFDEFAATQVDSLLRLARLLTGDPGDAEDLVQESLIRAHARWELVSGADHPGAYMRRLLVNVHRGRGRRKAVASVLVEDPVSWSPTSLAGNEVGWEDRDALRRTIAELPLRQRTVLVLRFYEDLETSEIASWMGLRESSVRSALSRALDSLRGSHRAQPEADEAPVRRGGEQPWRRTQG